MVMDFIKIVIGFFMLIGGAELLVRGAAAIALRLGISALVVGLTIVAFGTSSPELVVSAMAAVKGQSDIALGTVVGSNICNILLILGLSGLIWPLNVHKQVLKLDVPLMCIISVALAAILWTGEISRVFGGLLLFCVITYTWWTIRAGQSGETMQEEVDVDVPETPVRTWLLVVFIVSGPIMLSLGAKVLLDGAVNVATGLGVSEAVIGLTLVAVGGSLPELATAVAAAYRKEGDMVVGNIVGSNIFNILSVLGFAALATPIPFGPDTGVNWIDVGTMIGTAFVCAIFMRTGFRLARWECGVMLAGYCVYVWYLVQT